MGPSRFSPANLVVIAAGMLALAACPVEAEAAYRCGGQAFPLLTAPGGLSPYIALQADGISGAFQLDYGSTRSSLSLAAFDHLSVGTARHDVQRFSLPTFARGTFQLARYALVREPAGGQLGIVGTDFLSRLTADFSFGNGGDVILGFASCDAERLHLRGMVAIQQTGFFSSDLERIRHDMPNVPILPLRIGSVGLWAQIDTGYDDTAFPASIDINEALYQRLTASGVTLARVGVVAVTTCQGRALRQVYVSPGVRVAVEAPGHGIVRQIHDVRFIRKQSPGCGGIGGMSEPAAQLGMSVLRQFGSVVFDPKAELVWVPRDDVIN